MRKENGSALVAVLCLVFAGGILTAAVLSLSKIGTFTVGAHVARQRSMLVAEGAAARIQWLMAGDWKLFPSEKIGETDYESSEHDRYVADGVVHTMDYYGEKIQFRINDAVSGDDVVGNAATSLNRLIARDDVEEDQKEMVARVISKIQDYADSDSDVKDDSLEALDYEEQDMKPLPRNAAIQFREELTYIPEFTNLYPQDKYGRLSSVRLVAPSGCTLPSGKPSLYGADERAIRNYCTGLDDNQITEVVEALDVWRKERTLLSDTLDEHLLEQLKSAFSTSDSGVYTVTLEAPEDEGRPFPRLTFTYKGFDVGGAPNELIEYFEWNFH